MARRKFEKIVVVGASAGGINAIRILISALPSGFKSPIIIAQHMNAFMNMFFLDYLNSHTQLKVKEAQHMELLLPGRVYFIPPNYHGLYEDSRIILNADPKVNFSRPSIDAFFESVAFEEKENAIGVLLTGANNDGSYGMSCIEKNGGKCIVQNPEDAESQMMPLSAIKTLKNPQVEYLTDISDVLRKVVNH